MFIQFRIIYSSFTMTTLLPFALCLLSFTFYTTLASPPKLLPFHNHFDLTENITFPLTCSLLLESGQVSFQWTHNAVKLENSSDYRIDSSSPKFSFLTIPIVQRRHSGLYECRAVNNFGEADVTRTKINVQGNLVCVAVFEICSKCGAKAFFCSQNILFFVCILAFGF